jgi:hypothetical protein
MRRDFLIDNAFFDVRQTRTGFVVRRDDGRAAEYLGRDGFWTREARNALAFACAREAHAAIERAGGDHGERQR